MFGVPLVILLVWLYFRPPENPIKQLWRFMVRSHTEGMASLFRIKLKGDPEAPGTFVLCLFWLAVVALALASAYSFAVYIGLVENP